MEVTDSSEMGFAVCPLSSCPHDDIVNKIPVGFEADGPCENCGDKEENWICLVCYHIFCGRHRLGHGVAHYEASKHSMALSFCDLSVWCHACDSYVSNSKFEEAIRYVEKVKFKSE
ncbi:unnamed protein product [Bursaphelenchus okinawaensis]|uniref:UBP-type domain-containing protein n=1 Tax=Bursaphelenchus okinawaensis TaxID=465554 RepID=A0A811KUH4_9BILA|nr:unnamed protein product [Bursaphelenchus okinawaensis]CAG9112399.1 unnamed protein product [Bursaphelenchus okinawaensis]